MRNGVDRPIGDNDNGWVGSLGSWIEYRFKKPRRVRRLRLVFDSDLNRPWGDMGRYWPLQKEPLGVPETMLRAYRIEALDQNDQWRVVIHEENNYQRLVRLETDVETSAIRFIPEATWGAEQVHVFAWDVDI